MSACRVERRSGFTRAIRSHLASARPSGRWDNLPEFPINHPQKSPLPAIYARAPSSEPAGLWGNEEIPLLDHTSVFTGDQRLQIMADGERKEILKGTLVGNLGLAWEEG